MLSLRSVPYRRCPSCVPSALFTLSCAANQLSVPNAFLDINSDDSHLFLSALKGNNESTSYCVKPSVRRICPLDER